MENIMSRSRLMLSWATIMLLIASCSTMSSASSSAESVRVKVGATLIKDDETKQYGAIVSGTTSDTHGDLNLTIKINTGNNGDVIVSDKLTSGDNSIGPVQALIGLSPIIDSLTVTANGIDCDAKVVDESDYVDVVCPLLPVSNP